MRTLLQLSLSLVAVAALTACGTQPVGPDYVLPADAIAQKVAPHQPFSSADDATLTDKNHAAISSAPLPDRWWQLYADPQLDALVAKALTHNTDLRQALAHLEQVQAVEQEISGATRPSLSVGGGPSYGHASGLSVLSPGKVPANAFGYSATSGISYQLDLFGQIRRAIEAAQAGTEAAQAAVDLTRVNVAAHTASAYAQTCTAGLRIAVMQRSIELQQQSASISARLQKAGKVGSIDAQRANAQVEQLKAELPPLLALRQNALFQLATLTGEQPQNFPKDMQRCHTAPQVAAGVIPVGDGQALLQRRPDVRQAERQLAQATAQIGVATADLYPKISLGLNAGSAGHMTGFGRGDTFSWSLGPLISWSIPINGAAQARVAQSEAATKGALARFDGTVLNALRETETALTNYARELDRNARLQAARAQSAQVADETRRLYVNGKTGYLDSLDAERVLASADAALAASQASIVNDQLALFLALGGGWESGTQR
ncbi:TolC family protein [Diaphorobacter sp. HDW4A]|uniref:efflux transporter outer membrane subunit n=1 Tax=Diaphorobacter sp. HDW4A TaxID=2714924 RepID=UPI00140DE86E|nr:TolC family protein [Diaphorobacter sp. HDW4A]QIL83059.1 TolC family protein [Diaphorobacter sp. HDW4A]